MPKARSIKVIYKKLGREKAYGQQIFDVVEIDERLKGKKHLEILIHECTHFLFPEATEEEVTRKAILLTNTLWYDGYRKADHDESQPLQDGTI
jgi:hypothetical protein